MNQPEIVLVFLIVAAPVFAALFGFVLRRKRLRRVWAGLFFCFAVTATALIFPQHRNASEGSFAKAENLPDNTQWQVVSQGPLEKGFGAIIKDSDGKCLAVCFQEEPPKEFLVEKKGIWGFRKKYFTPVAKE